MQTRRLGILGAIALLPAIAQVFGTHPVPDATDRIAPRQHGPIRDRVGQGNGIVSTSIWSGFAATGNAFTAVRGSWIVPAANCSGGRQYASFWVGIDGYTSGTVEQIGTESDCAGPYPLYYAWYEFYPQPALQFGGLTIRPGDRMAAQVIFNDGTFTVTIADLTTGRSAGRRAVLPDAMRTSAEWIVEAPASGTTGRTLPLADFGTVLFGGDSTGVTGTCAARDSSTSGPIGSFPAVDKITMEKQKVKEAIPSELSSDGTSFSITWAAR